MTLGIRGKQIGSLAATEITAATPNSNGGQQPTTTTTATAEKNNREATGRRGVEGG
jgi:hypothetical protein